MSQHGNPLLMSWKWDWLLVEASPSLEMRSPRFVQLNMRSEVRCAAVGWRVVMKEQGKMDGGKMGLELQKPSSKE